MSRAADQIRALQRAGMSQRAIAEAIGRSPSYVSKVATGRKPGGNLGDALARLAGGATSAPVERRRTRSGELARVRASGGARSRRPDAPARRSREPDRDGLAGQVERGLHAGGMRGTLPNDSEWSVRAWRGADGWHDGGEGGTADPWSNPAAVEYVILDVPGVGYRQFAVFFTDDYDLAALVAEVLESYGVAE